MADATITIGGDISDLKRRLQEAGANIKSFGDKAKSQIGNIAAGSLIAGGTAGLVIGLVNSVKRLAGATADSVISLDSLKRGLAAVEGSSESTEARLESLRKVAAMPGLGFEESIQGFVGLRSVGLDAALAEGALVEMGNALAVVGKGKADLDGVLLALTQIVSKGKVSAEEINQIAERVPQVRAVMKDVFGTADTEVLQKMNISAEDFIRRLVDGFANKVPRASQSLQSSLDNMADSFKAMGAQIGGGVIPEVIAAMEGLTKWMENNLSVAGDAVGYLSKDIETLSFWFKVLKESSVDIFESNPFAVNQAEFDAWTTAKQKVNDYLKALEDVSKQRALADLVGVTEDPGSTMEQRKAAIEKYQDFIKNKSRVSTEEQKSAPKIDQDIATAKQAALRIANEMEKVDRMRDALGEREFQRILKHMTPMLQVEAIEKRITQEKERRGNEVGPLNEEQVLENQRTMMDLEDQLAQAVQRRGEAQKTAALDAADATQKAAEQTQALMDVEQELALLQALAAGKTKEAAAIERQMAVEQTKRAIMAQTGVGEDEAAKMAEQMQRLREKVQEREDKERGGPTKVRGYSRKDQGDLRDKLGPDSPLDQFEKMQQDRRLNEKFEFPGLEAYRKLQDRDRPVGQNPAVAMGRREAGAAQAGSKLESKLDQLIQVTRQGLLEGE